MKFDIFIRRAFEALKISSQNRLAILLGINRAGITQAKNKGTVPDKWILNLYRRYGVNPDWIETGKGNIFIAARDGSIIVPEYKSAPHVKTRLCAGDGSFLAGSIYTSKGHNLRFFAGPEHLKFQ